MHVALFLDTPQIKFFLHVWTFLVFLGIFAFLIFSAPPDFANTAPSYAEWLLFLYLISFFAHELKQFYRGDVKSLVQGSSQRIQAKFSGYFDSFWNRMDIALLLYFCAMIIFRFGLYANYFRFGVIETDSVFVLNLYSLYFVFWCLRLLQLFAVSASLGPKLIMIRLMIVDVLKIFLYIMIFALAYAVWLKVTRKTVSKDFLLGDEGGEHTTLVDMLLNINATDVAYFLDDLMEYPIWHLFGESFIESYDEYLPQKGNYTDYSYNYRVTMLLLGVPLMRFFYFLITVVLLLNLMIAIFQYSIDLAQAQADRNWNIYRYTTLM